MLPVLTEHSNRILISKLCKLLEEYLDDSQVKEIYRAYLFSAEAHEGQVRKSGEAYIFHPIAATYILGQMHSDTQTLCAALLHDVIEDTDVTKEELAAEFGKQVAELVDGVSKLSTIEFKTREHAQAASLRKMLLAMNHDIRVIIVKLADRLHNMRTLGAMSPASRRRIAQETLEIYAPIANRLGINIMQSELEELSFAAIYPKRYQILSNRLQKVYKQRFETFNNIKVSIEKQLAKYSVNATIGKRNRNPYRIYFNMCNKKKTSSSNKKRTFLQLMNVCSLRIIVDSKADCYLALGAVHSLYKPMFESFKDYIAIPKNNGYQSIHTLLFSSHGVLIEAQIRTTEMHKLSETGITTYGLDHFSSGGDYPNPSYRRASEWLKELLEIRATDSIEFLEHVKTDLFPEEVYVFTPSGEIMQLHKGATAIDFAYAIHTDIGNKCTSAKVDGQYVPLSTPLSSGQTVEVFTVKWTRPHPSWLNFAVSAKARSHIRHFLKNLQQDEAVQLGKDMLDKELATYSLHVDSLTEEQSASLLKTFKCDCMEKLLAEIGFGNRIALIVACQFDSAPSLPIENDKPKPLVIKGTENVVVNFASCCHPIPGDDIVAFISTGKGIIIHTAVCKLVAQYKVEKLQAVEWEVGIEGEFLVDIRVEVNDQRGVLANVATCITNMRSDIERVANENHDGRSVLKFCISVKSRDHLATIMRHIRRLECVTRVHRSRD
ncbi:bifunctional (p)ppGpp synthetase/guanosine-3',5'-bis(diphosphate) 3'-pyrophosphohydrolase [Candidatus Halobeggiatoa sp. HSG11]|nr:bifunctional (p)ppGpp synthetase/guanosine-3',5'-bis(diphosphate) 3'-pyrophosphohydrolase [Candidatus Halobeggiatoa sp. HSG11]